jgi:hypothetical protein
MRTQPSENGNNGASLPRQVAAKVQGAKEEAENVAEAVRESVTDRVRENPYGMLAAAFAVGYVAGGGLFTRTTARIIGLGARLAMIPQLRDPLLDVAEQAIDGLLDKTRLKGQ